MESSGLRPANPVQPETNDDKQAKIQAVEEAYKEQQAETQSGIELAAQYDLAEFEDELGWASGFGVIANYTYQESGAALDEFRLATAPINQILGRTDTDNSTPSLADDVVSQRITLDNLSENSYNITLFYDKHDLNVRMRYTWRDSFTQTANVMRFNLPPVIAARGQLNMSVSYDINERFSVGIEGVNLTREDSTRYCFNEGALLCEQDISDRRITVGITGKL
jgi:outer membrane receptor protein involved in Fe transport